MFSVFYNYNTLRHSRVEGCSWFVCRVIAQPKMVKFLLSFEAMNILLHWFSDNHSPFRYSKELKSWHRMKSHQKSLISYSKLWGMQALNYCSWIFLQIKDLNYSISIISFIMACHDCAKCIWLVDEVVKFDINSVKLVSIREFNKGEWTWIWLGGWKVGWRFREAHAHSSMGLFNCKELTELSPSLTMFPWSRFW